MKTCLSTLLVFGLAAALPSARAATSTPGPVDTPKIWSALVCYSNGLSRGISAGSYDSCASHFADALSYPPSGSGVTTSWPCTQGPIPGVCSGFPLLVEAGPDGDVGPILEFVRRREALRQTYQIDAYERELLELHRRGR